MSGAAKIAAFISDIPVDARVEFEAMQNDAQSEKLMIWKALENCSDEIIRGTVIEV